MEKNEVIRDNKVQGENHLGIVIQARTGSTRLPNKMILEYDNGRGIFEVLLNRLKKLSKDYPVYLATTTSEKDDILVEIAGKYEVKSYRGSEENVLKRFVESAEYFNLKKIIRVCADNPFLDIMELENLIQKFIKSDADYYSYTLDGTLPTIKTGFGFWAEGVRVDALKSVMKATANPFYLEHVTNYIYENSENYNIHLEHLEEYEDLLSIRLTVDTKVDFELSQEIFEACVTQNLEFTPDTIETLILKHPEWLEIMNQETERNRK